MESLIQTTVSALAQCVAFQDVNTELCHHSLSPESIQQIFGKTVEMLAGSTMCRSLRIAGDHLVAAYTIVCSMQSGNKSPDLGSLLLQKIASVHLGITLSVLVFPCSPIDPVGVENSKWKYLNIMVSLFICLRTFIIFL